MNPTPGLMSQLAQTMATGGSPMNIQTPGAPTYQPGLQQPTPPQMPDKTFQTSQGAPMQQMAAQQQLQQGQQGQMMTLPVEDQDPQSPGTQVTETEAEKIIKALSDRMKSLSKIHTQQTQHLYPLPEQPQGGQPSA